MIRPERDPHWCLGLDHGRFEQMSDEELERLATAAEWPERFAGVAGYLPGRGEE